MSCFAPHVHSFTPSPFGVQQGNEIREFLDTKDITKADKKETFQFEDVVFQCVIVFREETKGRCCKRVVLANVPSFRFLVLSFRFLYRARGPPQRDRNPRSSARGSMMVCNTMPAGLKMLSKIIKTYSQQFPSCCVGRFWCAGATVTIPILKKLENVQGEKKHTHTHTQTQTNLRDCPGTGLAQKMCLCVFLGRSLWGRKTHKQKFPQKSRDNPVKILFACFFLYVFFSVPKTFREFGLKFWCPPPTPGVAPRVAPRKPRASHQLGRECSSETCSKNTSQFRELLREWPFPLREVFLQNWGGSQACE